MGDFEKCFYHRKDLKFMCWSPCSVFFCLDCAESHRNHFIRDLVNFPLLKEAEEVGKLREKICEKIEKIEKLKESAEEEFTKIRKNHRIEENKIQEQHKKINKVLNEGLKKSIRSITEHYENQKKNLLSYNQVLEDLKKKQIQELQLIDSLKMQRPDYCYSILNKIHSLTDFCEYPAIPETRPLNTTLIPDLSILQSINYI